MISLDKISLLNQRTAKYGSDTLFVTLNKHLTRGYVFDADSFKDTEPKRLKKYSREFVYYVPWYKAMPVYLDTLDMETIELY